MPERLPYLVEPMTLDDIDQVMEIEQIVFPAPWSARAYQYEITKNDHSTMLVVRAAGTPADPLGRVKNPGHGPGLLPRKKPLGTAAPKSQLSIPPRPRAVASWLLPVKRRLGLIAPPPVLGYAGLWLLVDETHICTIAVHPQWQGRGLGELLIVSLLDQSTILGAHRATLEVRVSNSAALELYLKYGFEIVSRRKRYYTDNNEDAYIMTTPPFETADFQTSLDRCRRQLHARLRDQDTNRTTQGNAPSLAQDRQAIHAREQQAG